jgi:hypothetical protein
MRSASIRWRPNVIHTDFGIVAECLAPCGFPRVVLLGGVKVGLGEEAQTLLEAIEGEAEDEDGADVGGIPADAPKAHQR